MTSLPFVPLLAQPLPPRAPSPLPVGSLSNHKTVHEGLFLAFYIFFNTTMKLNKVLSAIALVCLLVVGISTQADATAYTVALTSSGPNPGVLTVQAGDVIGFTGIKDGEFYGGTVTDAPAGSKVTVGGNEQWLAGCLDFSFIADVAGTYSYEVTYVAGVFSGTVAAAVHLPKTYGVYYDASGITAPSLDVKVGDIVVFYCGAHDTYKYTGIHWTSDPSGSFNSITDAGLVCETQPLTVTEPGTYSYVLRYQTSRFDGSIIATAATAAVQTTAQSSGLSMTVNPAPSNGAATITFNSDKPRDLQLALFDASGKQVHAYDNVKLGLGEYSLPLSSTTLPNGDYFLRAISAGGIVATAKVMIVH